MYFHKSKPTRMNVIAGIANLTLYVTIYLVLETNAAIEIHWKQCLSLVFEYSTIIILWLSDNEGRPPPAPPSTRSVSPAAFEDGLDTDTQPVAAPELLADEPMPADEHNIHLEMVIDQLTPDLTKREEGLDPNALRDSMLKPNVMETKNEESNEVLLPQEESPSDLDEGTAESKEEKLNGRLFPSEPDVSPVQEVEQIGLPVSDVGAGNQSQEEVADDDTFTKVEEGKEVRVKLPGEENFPAGDNEVSDSYKEVDTGQATLETDSQERGEKDPDRTSDGERDETGEVYNQGSGTLTEALDSATEQHLYGTPEGQSESGPGSEVLMDEHSADRSRQSASKPVDSLDSEKNPIEMEASERAALSDAEESKPEYQTQQGIYNQKSESSDVLPQDKTDSQLGIHVMKSSKASDASPSPYASSTASVTAKASDTIASTSRSTGNLESKSAKIETEKTSRPLDISQILSPKTSEKDPNKHAVAKVRQTLTVVIAGVYVIVSNCESNSNDICTSNVKMVHSDRKSLVLYVLQFTLNAR